MPEQIPSANIDSVAAAAIWIAAHDAKINAYWDEQRRINEDFRANEEKTKMRVSALEKRVAVLTTIAALIGSVAGSVITSFFV